MTGQLTTSLCLEGRSPSGSGFLYVSLSSIAILSAFKSHPEDCMLLWYYRTVEIAQLVETLL